MTEHPGRERPLADDDPRVRRRTVDLAGHDVTEHEVAERAVAVPALKARVILDEPRFRDGVEAVERLEPRDARVPVTELAALLGIVEMLPERLGAAQREAQRLETAQSFLTLHGGRTPAPASRARRRCDAAPGRD